MSKRKRSTDSSANMASKKTSSRRRAFAPAEDDDDIICIDLDNEPDTTAKRKEANGASSSKKKKVDVAATTTAASTTSKNVGTSSKAQPLNTNYNQRAAAVPVAQPYNFSTPPKPVGRNNGSQKENEEDEGDVTDTGKPSNFKVPEVPRPKGPKPSTSAAALKPDTPKKQSSRKAKLTAKQLETTELSRSLRKAFMEAIQDALEDAAQDSETVHLGNIVDNILTCIPSRFYIFATRRLPEGPKHEDFSSDLEIEEFCRWWLLGITALLFSCRESVVKKIFLKTKTVLATLCQLILSGHPTIVNKIAVPLLKVLRDLLVRSGKEIGEVPTLKLALDSNQLEKKHHNFEIKLTEANEWLIPHYIQAISPILTRISFHNVYVYHTLNNLLQRLLSRLTTAETVAAVLCAFPSFMLTDAHSFFLTEEAVCNIYKTIFQAPTLPQVDKNQIRHVFNDFDLLQESRFTELLSQESGLRLLQNGIKELMYSDQFALINKDDLNQVILKAFKFVTEASSKSTSWIAEEVIPLTKFVTKNGLETVVHPLIEEIILNELLSYVNSSNGSSISEPLDPRIASKVWDQVFQCWEESLEVEYRSVIVHQQATSMAEDLQADTLSFFTSTAALTKLVDKILKELKKQNFRRALQFFDYRHLQRWSDVSFVSLKIGIKLNPVKFYRLYESILETMVHLDSCNWFKAEISMQFLNNLLTVPGWLWLTNFKNLLPQRFSLPIFTRNFKNSDLQFIRGSSLLVQKAIRALRLEMFRPWCCFVCEIYLLAMQNPTVHTDPFLTKELLRAIADVSWVFKEVVPLRTTFEFVDKIVKSDIWKAYSCVRSALAEAITSLPCICEYNATRNRPSYHAHVPLVSRSGCEKVKCTSYAKNPSLETDSATEEDQIFLKDAYIKNIMKLALPLLRSKFILVKLTLSNLIMSCHNHVKFPSELVIVPMLEVALNGHTIVCEKIFQKIGMLVISTAKDFGSNGSGTSGVELEITQKIFSAAIPQLCKKKQAQNANKRLPLRTREKIVRGVLEFSTVGPMSISIFVEILKCIIPIVAQTRGNENTVTILTQQIVVHFAEVHNCVPYELMTRVRREIAKCIVKSAINVFYHPSLTGTLEQQRLHMTIKFLQRLVYIGKFRNLSFAGYFYPPLMEIIVPNIVDEPYQFLLAALEGHESELQINLLQQHIINYFPTMLLDHPPEKIARCIRFLKDRYQLNTIGVVKQQEQRILNETLSRLFDREEKVMRIIPHLCKLDEPSSRASLTQGTASKSNPNEVRDLLSKRLLGFFIHLDTKLQSRFETTDTKLNILQSFIRLMKLMGKKITSVKSKIYKTLYSATKDTTLHGKVLFEAWKEFANCLELEKDSSCFEGMTTQILASLLPLRQCLDIRSKVDGLISHFVCYKKDLTAKHHHELYFLLDQCENQEVLQAVGDAIDRLKQKNWSDYFNMIVKEASNENPCIRFQAFRKLRDIFRFDWDRVEKCVLVKGQEYVSHLISTLLTGLRGTGNSEDVKLRELIVDCLGCLGALDPVRFRSEDDDGKSKTSLVTSLAISGQMNTFVGLYLRELVHEFQEVKDTTNFDYLACLIQIVLQEFNVRPDPNDDKIWNYLTKEQQETATPMFSTQYQMDSGSKTPDICSPIYLSQHGQGFESWLINWMCVLISYINENKEPKIYSLFRKSMNVLKTNVRIATFVMPFLTMYAIFCASREQRQDIITEIKTILERWVILDEMKQKAHSIAPIRDSEVEFGLKKEPMSVENESVFHSRCTQVVFSILDHLLRTLSLAKRKWTVYRKANEMHHMRREPTPTRLSPPMSENDLAAVEIVLKAIPNILISEVACNCGSFPAALYYLEQELKSNPCELTLQNNVDYLQRLYICLDDMDSVGGVASLRTGEQSFSCQILEDVVNGKTQQSVKRLEQMAIRNTDDFQLHQALVRAYLKVEEPHSAETFINATLTRQPEWEIDLQEVHMEALVKLQKWTEVNAKVDDLEEMKGNQYLEDKFLTWNVAVPRIISKLQRNQTEAATELVTELKTALVAPLVALCESLYPYKTAYPHLVQLHILTEIDEAIKLISKYYRSTAAKQGSTSTQAWVQKDVSRMINKWEARLWNVSKSRKMIDQILNVRKHIFEIMKTVFHESKPVCDILNATIRECWLDSAREASKSNDFARADNCLLFAKRFMSPKVMIEEAKILNRKGEKENAISTLEKCISQCFNSRIGIWKSQKIGNGKAPAKPAVPSFSGNVMETDTEDKLLCSKAMLLLANLCEEQKLLDMEDYIAKYKEASEVYKESEKNLFTLGSYHDRLWNAADKSQPQGHAELTLNVVRYYSQSLMYGCKYVYQSLPRLLSIWFDFAAGIQSGEMSKQYASSYAINSNGSNSECSYNYNATNSNSSSSSNSSRPPTYTAEAVLDSMNSSIKKLASNVPPYILMTAFTQLVSRLCHAHVPTWQLLKEIIVRIIRTHPYQTLWMTMSVNKSVNRMRRNRCQEIYKSAENGDKERTLRPIINNYNELTAKLIQLCDRHIAKEISKTKLSIVFNDLPQLIEKMGPGKVAIPFQVFINLTLPRKGISHKEHNPYPESLVFIQGIKDDIEVMHSLIRPKKITLVATNGKTYGLMCKPKDDLRKDNKVMEVNNVVNWYLAQNSESSQRRLHVRTYAVVPLNEECGLLEWVPNMATLRSVLGTLYKEKNITIFRGPNPIQRYEDIESKKRKFINILLRQTPPVFSDWFFNQFNDHQSWYTARMSYTRTAAVISMVGYIMGLGDRHCENILIDTVTGEICHVDFNCLFNKGESFDWPERVPFRLTHNMVDGMGPLKYEGVFRKTCEIVMGMFREHASIFLSVLRPFVFDPLVEWQKTAAVASLEGGEATNEKAVETMKYIRHRLNGTARNKMRDINTERSVKAHVNYLIEEATSIENLCQMWVGWAAYM